jgi:UDP-glucose 4-epimerase
VTGAGGRILVAGSGSFIARALAAELPPERLALARHDALARADLLDGIATVVACLRHPGVMAEGYDLERDPELALARRLGDRPIRWLMLSSRKVYAPSERPLREDSPLGPSDAYGRNKLALEGRLAALLGERLTILRLANIFGWEHLPGRRSFMGAMLARLARTGEVELDVSPFTPRDFLPVEACARILARLAPAPPGGVVNVGSGIALPLGRLALWVIEGFGRGRLVVTDPRERDAFTLDTTRLGGPPCHLEDLRRTALAQGRRLGEEVG